MTPPVAMPIPPVFSQFLQAPTMGSAARRKAGRAQGRRDSEGTKLGGLLPKQGCLKIGVTQKVVDFSSFGFPFKSTPNRGTLKKDTDHMPMMCSPFCIARTCLRLSATDRCWMLSRVRGALTVHRQNGQALNFFILHFVPNYRGSSMRSIVAFNHLI